MRGWKALPVRIIYPGQVSERLESTTSPHHLSRSGKWEVGKHYQSASFIQVRKVRGWKALPVRIIYPGQVSERLESTTSLHYLSRSGKWEVGKHYHSASFIQVRKVRGWKALPVRIIYPGQVGERLESTTSPHHLSRSGRWEVGKHYKSASFIQVR